MICPLCNGLYLKELYCPQCGDVMTDNGILEGFFEPYRPYLDVNILQQNDGITANQCLHLFTCFHCGYDQRHIVNKINNC